MEAVAEAQLLLDKLNDEYRLAGTFHGVMRETWEPFTLEFIEGPRPIRRRFLRLSFAGAAIELDKAEGGYLPVEDLLKLAGIELSDSLTPDYIRGWLGGARLPYER